MPFVANDEYQIWYELTGRGDGVGTLLPQTKVGWSRMGYVNALASRGKVVVVDPRGYGLSSRSRSGDEYGLDACCDDLLAAADAVGMERFIAWGYSNTAALAFALACRSDRVAAVACCGMDPFLDFSAPAAYMEKEPAEAGEGEYAPEGTFDWRAANAFYRDYSAWQARIPAKIPCPAVIVYGDGDDLIRGSVAANRDRLAAMGFAICELPGLDHQSCVEAAPNVVATIDGALERTAIRSTD
jgi:pimeloyl-ACP methyl ester carboxylesterase